MTRVDQSYNNIRVRLMAVLLFIILHHLPHMPKSSSYTLGRNETHKSWRHFRITYHCIIIAGKVVIVHCHHKYGIIIFFIYFLFCQKRLLWPSFMIHVVIYWSFLSIFEQQDHFFTFFVTNFSNFEIIGIVYISTL